MFFEGQRAGEQERVSALNPSGAIELMGELDGFAGVAARARQGRQGDDMSAESYGVVGGDDALIVQAETTGEIEAARETAKVRSRVGGGAGEALVIVGAELGEHGVGLFQSWGLGETEFADETVLAGAPGALDAAFGLRRVGGDRLDAELIEGATELGGSWLTGELFGEGPVGIVARKDGVAIAVEAAGDAVGGDHGVEGAEIAESIFGFELEVRGKDLAGGVVLPADEGEDGATALEPVVATGVGEDHHAETRAGRATGAVLARPALVRRSPLGGAQDTAHGFAAHGQALLSAKFFYQMGIVEAPILAAG